MNFKLNPGGIILAIVGLLAAILIVTLVLQPQNSQTQAQSGSRRGGYFICFGGMFVGGLLGNFLWTLIFPPKKRS